MKRQVAVSAISLVAALGFTVANASDYPSSASAADLPMDHETPSDTSSSIGENQAGSVAKDSAESASTSDTAMVKTCTDNNGVTFQKDEKGFWQCRREMKKAQNQQGGSVNSSGGDSGGGN